MLFALLSSLLLTTVEPFAPPLVLQRYASAIATDRSVLTLYTDNSFKYESRGDSCWLWHEQTGTWSKNGDLFRLTYTVSVDDSRQQLAVEGTFSDPSRILVVVTDPAGAPLRDIRVTFNGHGLESPTGPDGLALVDYEDIPEASGSGWCKSKQLGELIVVAHGRTSTFTVTRPSANYFEVVLDPSPASHQERHDVIYRVVGRKLVKAAPDASTGADGAGVLWVDALKTVDQ